MAESKNATLSYPGAFNPSPQQKLAQRGAVAILRPVMIRVSMCMVALAAAAVAAAQEAGALKLQQSGIKGLVVMELSAGVFAAKATQMNCTAVPAAPGAATSLQFNQTVGPDMAKALAEVQKFLAVRYGRLPTGYRLELAFEDKYSPKDGPSAAVACALMVHSLMTGSEIDGGFAVTGDLNADGSVQPVGGVADKVRGAANRNCTHVGIPAGNAGAISDLLLLEGPEKVWDIQIFSLETFDQALGLAAPKREVKLQQAMDQFAAVQKVLKQRRDPALLMNAKVQQRLQAVVEAAPQHLSARLLLLAGSGKGARMLSLGGSLEQIEKAAAELLKQTRTPRPEGVDQDVLASRMAELRRLRGKLDGRTVAFADAVQALGDGFRALKNHPTKSSPEQVRAIEKLTALGLKVDAEADKLRTNKQLMEELMK